MTEQEKQEQEAKKKGKTYERIHQNRIIQSPNPTRIQRLGIENLHALQVSQSLQPLQPSRLVNIRWNLSGLPAVSEQLRGWVSRLSRGGKRECAGRSGGGRLGPNVQTCCGSRKAEDMRQHFLFRLMLYMGERGTWVGRESERDLHLYADVKLEPSGKRG